MRSRKAYPTQLLGIRTIGVVRLLESLTFPTQQRDHIGLREVACVIRDLVEPVGKNEQVLPDASVDHIDHRLRHFRYTAYAVRAFRGVRHGRSVFSVPHQIASARNGFIEQLLAASFGANG